MAAKNRKLVAPVKRGVTAQVQSRKTKTTDTPPTPPKGDGGG